METEKRKKIFWLVAIILVILVLILWISQISDKLPENATSVNKQPEFKPASSELNYQPSALVESNLKFSAKNLAKSYVERFGSWSSDSQGHNLEELASLSSVSMQEYLASIEINDSEQFSGVSSKSMTAKILDIDDSQAKIVVNTQRISTDSNFVESVFYQEIIVELIRSDNSWLVNSAIWQ